MTLQPTIHKDSTRGALFVPSAALCLCFLLAPAVAAAADQQGEAPASGSVPASSETGQGPSDSDEDKSEGVVQTVKAEAARDQRSSAKGAPTTAKAESAGEVRSTKAESTSTKAEASSAAATQATPEASYELEPVTVTATRSEQKTATAPASVSVITGKELEKLPVGDLTDAIRDVPGVSLAAGSQGRRTLQIRGMGSGHTLVLIDGKRVNSSEAVFRHNDYDIGMVPTEAIERIEVVRGSMSSLYGSEALGGVINIITKPVSNEWTAGIDAKAQTPLAGRNGEELRSSLYVSGPLVQGKLGLRLTGAFDQRLPWHGDRNPGQIVEDDKGGTVLRPDGSVVYRGDLATLEGRRDHNGRARLVWTPDSRNSIAAEYGQAYQTREGEYFIRGYGVADTTIDRRDFVLSHDGRWTWGVSQVRGYRETIDTKPDDLHQGNWVIEGNSTIFLGEHALTVGAEGRWVALESESEFTSGEASVTQQAVYAQDEFPIIEDLSLLVGSRLDHHENFGLHVTPRGYLVYTPLDALTLKGGVGTGFRAPTLRQLSDESIVNSCRGACVIIGNPDLSPERSVNYELSASYEPRGWGIGATVFQTDVSDLIDTPRGAGVTPVGQTAEGLDIFLPRNVNQARLRGLETTLRYEPWRVLAFRVNHTLLDARDLDEDVQLDNRPKHSLNGQADWRITQQFSVFSRAQFIGEQKSGDETIESYPLFDAGVSYRPHEAFGMSLGMLNIADRRTESDDGYSYQERGRTIYLGMNATY